MRKSEQLYDRYAQPLEGEHAGKYVAISPDGQVLLGDTMLEVAQQATERFGRGNFVFKLGPRAVGKWR
jgi:hypothetical protein